MGCLKLTYQTTEPQLKVVHRNRSREEKCVQWFLRVDPLADQMPSWSSYNYVFNNPILLIDPLGLAPELNDGKFQDPPGSNQKSADKCHTKNLIYFKNETEGYNYLYKSANFEGNQSGVVEHFAWIMPEGGVAVLPTIGTNSLGQEFKNNISTADWKYLPYEVGDNGIQVQLNGNWQKPLASIHTHPGKGWISGEDRKTFSHHKTPGLVMTQNYIYGLAPNKGINHRPSNLLYTSDLLKGYSISKNIQFIYSELEHK